MATARDAHSRKLSTGLTTKLRVSFWRHAKLRVFKVWDLHVKRPPQIVVGASAPSGLLLGDAGFRIGPGPDSSTTVVLRP